VSVPALVRFSAADTVHREPTAPVPDPVGNDAAVAVRGVRKRFGARQVLDEVDADYPSGQVTAIVGPNGAGKTTLIKLMVGLVTPDSGTIRIEGVSIAGKHEQRARLGYMPQMVRFPERLTGTELLALWKDLRQSADRPATSIEQELIGAFRLEAELDRPLSVLSGGTRQKINALAALLFRPQLLILDEPTAGLDPSASGVLKEKILEERRAGRTIIVTSHIMSDLEEMADHLVFLLDGRVHYAGPLRDAISHTGQHSLERAVASLMSMRPAGTEVA